MQINENQKAVPKNLRNTLNADLLWNSDDRREQIKALKLQIAQHLGDQRSSPLYGRVIVGETPRTTLRCVTIEAIRIGLDRSNFFGTFTTTEVEETGTFYKGANQPTFEVLVPYLEGCLWHLRVFLPDQWEIPSGDEGFVFINAGIESLLRVFSDIVDHLVGTRAIDPNVDEVEKMVQESLYYLDPLITYIDDLPTDQRLELRRGYGAGGRVRYWRTLQRAINGARPEFSPEGLEECWKDEAKLFNTESFAMIRDIETVMKEDFRTRLKSKYGNRWLKDGVPQKVHKHLVNGAFDKNRDREESQEVEPWDCLHIINYRDIATYNHASPVVGFVHTRAVGLSQGFSQQHETNEVVVALLVVQAELGNCDDCSDTGFAEPRFGQALDEGNDLEVLQEPILKTNAVVTVEPFSRGNEYEPPLLLQKLSSVKPEIDVVVGETVHNWRSWRTASCSTECLGGFCLCVRS